jgi:hypothetical protein
MRFLGLWALKPFLQDTIRLVPLTLTMWGMMAAAPRVVLRVLRQVGAAVVAGWALHYLALLAYTAADAAAAPLRRLLGGREGRGGGYVLQRWVLGAPAGLRLVVPARMYQLIQDSVSVGPCCSALPRQQVSLGVGGTRGDLRMHTNRHQTAPKLSDTPPPPRKPTQVARRAALGGQR